MATTNIVVLSVRLGADPEMRYTNNGKQVATVDAALQLGFGDNKKTMWLRLEGWDKTAERLNQFAKGDTMTITGRLDEDQWDDKETGQPRKRTKIAVTNIDGFPKSAGSADSAKVPF